MILARNLSQKLADRDCTLFDFRGRDRFGGECSFFERPPFEVFLVAPANNISLVTLLTRRFHLIALQSLCFTCDAAWKGGNQPIWPTMRERSMWPSIAYHFDFWIVSASSRFPP